MLRLRAYICLFLFVFSTVGANATVHLCEGEITDVSLIANASCEHEDEKYKEEKEDCKSHCCKKEAKKEIQEEDDCCDTERLSEVEIFLTQIQKQDYDIVVRLVPSFYDFYFENHKVLLKNIGLAYMPPPPIEEDICIEVQCFRI